MRILIAMQGQPHDELALHFSLQIASHSDDPAIVLMVINDAIERPQAEAVLDRAREVLAPVHQVYCKIRIGSLVREIVREAMEHDCELIVIADRAYHNPLKRLLNASHSIQLIERAPCPVIVVKGQARPIIKILLCDSGAAGPLADRVLSTPASGNGAGLLARFTAQLAGLLSGEEEITVLHVMSQISAGPGVRGTQLRAGADELIQAHTPEGELLLQDVQVLIQPGVKAQPKVRHGLVLDEILAEVRSGDYDLIVIGAHRGAGWQRLLLDDLAQKIVTRLDRPVVVVK